MNEALRTMLNASAACDEGAVAPEEMLALVQQKIREGIDPTDDEMRLVILAGRAGRRSAAQGQKKARSAAPSVSIDTLFKRPG